MSGKTLVIRSECIKIIVFYDGENIVCYDGHQYNYI